MRKYFVCTAQVFIFLIYYVFVSYSQLPADEVSAITRVYEIFANNTGVPYFMRNNVPRNSTPCLWRGVSCNPDNSTIKRLSFSSFSVSTSEFLPILCTLPNLESLDVSNNRLISIPGEFFTGCRDITGLKLLNFSKNTLNGDFPDFTPDFTGFRNLEFLDLSYNFLSGQIGQQLDGLGSLRSLNLSHNRFSGALPTNLGSKNLLEELQLSANSFTGEIPSEITKYRNLTVVDLSINNLTGLIPGEFGLLTRLKTLVLSINHLSGGIPASLSNITALSSFAASQNSFNGTVPSGITSFLESLDLSFNKLTGGIQSDLLSGPNLRSVDLSYNLLEGKIPENISNKLFRLRLGSNLLNGPIPSSPFRNLVGLMYLEVDNNTLDGEIPSEIGMCRSLALLNLGQNRFTGVLPPSLGDLSNLQVLNLQMNSFVGELPSRITELNRLQKMNISRNSLHGWIPSSISSLKNLANLDLQRNNLSGSIPNSIGSLSSLIELQLGDNHLKGPIPELPLKLQIALNLSHNLFVGRIPVTLSKLTGLEVLDLSNNRFSGEIPDFLTSMTSLTQLVLSNNTLSGLVPLFQKYVKLETEGNKGLIYRKPTPPPSSWTNKSNKSFIILVTLTPFLGLALYTLVVALLFSRYFPRIKDYWIIDNSILRSEIDFRKSMRAVRRRAKIIMKTDFYTYYKALLPNGTNYCIKQLNWSNRAFKLHNPEKFHDELRNLALLRNPNIMAPHAYTLTARSAYLIYNYAHYGTLYDLLHGSSCETVSWEDRYEIAVGIAGGLAYLHGSSLSGSPFVLLNLSTRNVLMKSSREALIGDYELAKVINPSTTNGTLSVVAGIVGYTPPEYPYTMRVTASCNVYSLGVIMLELLTGKPAVIEGNELAKHVMSRSMEDDNWDPILDHRIIRTSTEVHHQMLSVLKVALSCISISIGERPDAKQVHEMLLDVAQEFVV